MAANDEIGLASRARARTKSRSRRLSLGLLAAVAVLGLLLAAAQLVLPPIATSRLESSLRRSGTGVHVSVSAFPALELLFGHADSVTVSIAHLRASSHHVGNLLARARAANDLTASMGELDAHGLRLTGVSLVKRGARLSATASISTASVQSVLPPGLSVAPLNNGADGLIVRGRLDVLGHSVGATVSIQADNGKIVLRPQESGVASLLDAIHITIYSDPLVCVDRVTAVEHDDHFALSATGHYR